MTQPEPAVRLRGGGSTDVGAPKPPEAQKKEPKSKKKDLKEVKESWAKIDEFDDRQKHDMALLGKQAEALRTREPKKKRRSEQTQLDPSIPEILEKYCEGPEQNPLLQMQQALKELVRQLAMAQERADAAEETLTSVQEQLEVEAASRREADVERLQASQRVEELELAALQFQAERQTWEQRAASAASAAASAAAGGRSQRERELEVLLKEAILKGAQMSRAKAQAEAALGDAERLGTSAQREAQRQKRRSQRLAQQRRGLESSLRAAERRGDSLEERLAEYLSAAAGGAEKVLEAHMQHLAAAGASLAAKVEEQQEIMQVLRGLLQESCAPIQWAFMRWGS